MSVLYYVVYDIGVRAWEIIDTHTLTEQRFVYRMFGQT